MRLEDFKSRLDVSVATEGYILARCPFHPDKNPSLIVYGSGWFECKSPRCRERGPWDKLWSFLTISTPYLCRGEQKQSWIPKPRYEEPYGIYARDRHRALMELKRLQDYVRQRGVWDMVRHALIGYDNGWYTLPVRDVGGTTVGIVSRAGPSISGVRFHQPFGQRPMLYTPCWQMVEETDGPIAIVFGMFDALALASMGHPVFSPTAGQESLDPSWLDEIRRRFVIIPDRYEEKAAQELAAGLDWRAYVYIVDYPDDTKDPNDLLVRDRDAAAEEFKDLLCVWRDGESEIPLQG